jgi:hypothetical protein
MRTTIAFSVAGLLLSPQLTNCVPIERAHQPLAWAHVRRMTEGANPDLGDLGTLSDTLSPFVHTNHLHDSKVSSVSNVQLLGYVSDLFAFGSSCTHAHSPASPLAVSLVATAPLRARTRVLVARPRVALSPARTTVPCTAS